MKRMRSQARWFFVGMLLILSACASSDPPMQDPEDGPGLELMGEDGLTWSMEVGESASIYFEIANQGASPLGIAVGWDASWLAIMPPAVFLAPDEVKQVEARASCSEGAGTWETTVTLVAEDPQIPRVEIPASLECITTVEPGAIAVDIEGLPAGVDASGRVIGPGVDVEYVGAGTIEDLAPGSYTVRPDEIFLTEGVYRASEIDVLVESEEVSEVLIEYLLNPGGLDVDFEGLPAGVEHRVELIDEEGRVTRLPQSGSLAALKPGEYELLALEVEVGLARYDAGGANQSVVIISGESAKVTVSYEVVLGAMRVKAQGLSSGMVASFVVDGQPYEGAERLIEGLEPGEYPVSFDEVVSGASIFRVDPAERVVQVASAETTEVVADYELVPGAIEIEVLEFGASGFEVRLDGPGDLEQTVTTSTTIAEAEPGLYALNAEVIPVDGLGNPWRVEIEPPLFTLESEQTQVVSVRVSPGTMVIREDDDGPGTLREVLGNIVEGSVVEFADSVEEIGLSGGALVVDFAVTIQGRADEATVIDGMAGPIFRVSSGGELRLRDLTLEQGAAAEGGAVRVGTGAFVSAERVRFIENMAEEEGGAIYVASGGLLSVEESIFQDNLAGTDGGAIAMSYSVGLSPLSEIMSSLFTGNEAIGDGGALFLNGESWVWESTFADNSAGSFGGAVMLHDGEASLVGVTVSGNEAEYGGGIFYFGDSYTTLYLGRSIVAGNTAPTGGPDLGRYESETAVISLGSNVVGVDTAGIVDGVNGDQAGSIVSPLNAELTPLSENGGFSATMAPGATSPARFAVWAPECEAMGDAMLPLGDQRGQPRPAGAFCTAGAWEMASSREGFDDADMSAGSYQTGQFVGADGISWEYSGVRRVDAGGAYSIEGRSLILRSGDGWIRSQTQSGGISSLSFQAMKAFTSGGNRYLEVWINDELREITQAVVEDGKVYRFAVSGLGISGDFDIEIRNMGDQVTIDNLSWQ